MEITRQLKKATWTYREADHTFLLETTDGGRIVIDRIYAFSLARFLLRGIYRMTMKHRKVKDVDLEVSPDEKSEFSSETSHSDDI